MHVTEADALDLITQTVTLRTTSALTRTIVELIESGGIPQDTHLPTIRQLADALGMSRTAVGQSWRQLQAEGLIESRRRGGTTVIAQRVPPHAKRFESMIRSSIAASIDLGNLSCRDMPPFDLASAFSHALTHSNIGNQFAEQISPQLRDAVKTTWPFPTDSFMTLHGSIDTLEMSLSALVHPGDRVAIASPTIPRVFDILESLSAAPVIVAMTDGGPDLADLKRAMISKPTAFVYQPTFALPAGGTVSPEWVTAAAEILSGSIPILEFDQTWPLGGPRISLGTLLPDQVLHTRSFGYAFGTDMRQAVVGGNPWIIDLLWNRLSYSSRYVSRITQLAQAFLLKDLSTLKKLAKWDKEIHRRHSVFVEALRERGHTIEESSPPFIWLPVPDEHSTCARLSNRGIVVHPGSFFHNGKTGDPRIAIHAAAQGSDIERLADEISRACDTRLYRET